MNGIENQIDALIDAEYASANKKFAMFGSRHEAYAVIREEVDELAEASEDTEKTTRFIWEDVKRNSSNEVINKELDMIEKRARHTAIEAIQVAAMCRKWKESKV